MRTPPETGYSGLRRAAVHRRSVGLYGKRFLSVHPAAAINSALVCSQRQAMPFYQWPGPRPCVTITKSRRGRSAQCWVMDAWPTQRTTIEKAKSRAGGRCSVFHDELSGCAGAAYRNCFRFIVILSLAALLAACETTVSADQRIAEYNLEFSDWIISDVKVNFGPTPGGKTRWRPGPSKNSFVIGEGNIAFFS